MQCASCQFENMPGTEVCGRCGARLELEAVALDVHPPRAGRWEKRLRRWSSTFAWFDRSRTTVLDARASLSVDLTAGTFLRMIVPGWPQIACGRRLIGWIFLGSYLASLLLGLIFVGTFPGGVLLGLAISLHASSVLDVIFRATPEWPLRLFYSLVCVVLVALVVYLPPGWLIARVAVPQRIVLTTPPFERGDVVLYNPSAYRRAAPELGDVVLYEIPQVQADGQTAGGYNAVYNVVGRRIDRIVACPGQKVECTGGEMRIDGRPSPWLPLNPDRLPPGGLSLTVPGGHYLIVPTTNPQELIGVAPEDWRRMSLVPTASLLGRVYLRHQPLRRLWRIR